MADRGEIERILEANYGMPRRAPETWRYDPTTEPYPLPPRRGAELRQPAERPGDPMLGQVFNEATAAAFGRNVAHGNYGRALLDAAELAVGAFPGAKGRGRGPRAGEAGARKSAGAGPEAGGVPDRGGVPGGDRWVPASRGSVDPYVAVPGQPSVVKIPGHGELEARPIPQIEAAAREYAQSRGRPYEVAAGFDPLDIERSKRIAAAYEAMRNDPHDPAVRRAYDAMIEETLGQYRALDNKGIQFRFNEGGQDPYAKSPALGYIDMRDNGRLFVFPTVEGYGERGGLSREAVRNNPLLQDTGVKFGDRPALANDVFRAVHDAYGHNGPGNPFFRGPGEDRAFGHHSIMYGPEAIKAATSELRGQNSWLNYGPYADFNKGKSGADTKYAEQKIGVMPEWTWMEGLPRRRALPGTDVQD